jgi:hypothetical protein
VKPVRGGRREEGRLKAEVDDFPGVAFVGVDEADADSVFCRLFLASGVEGTRISSDVGNDVDWAMSLRS